MPAQDTEASVGLSDVISRDRLPSLTGLRFWAALLVVGYHLTHQVGSLGPLSALVQYGRTGVTFFFVVSGFVLAWTYMDRPTPFAVFLWRRFARLWPLVVVTGILSLLIYRLMGVDVPPLRALSTFTFMQAWSSSLVKGANPAAWSLSDEAFFYFTFPLVLAIAVRPRLRRWAWWLVALAILVGWLLLLVLPGWAFNYLPPIRAVQFALGVLCAVAMRRGAKAPVGFRTAVVGVVIYHLALIPWSAIAVSGAFGVYSGSQWWAAPVFALLIMAAAESDGRGSSTGVSQQWALRLGHWSFAWYLVHEPVIRLWSHYVEAPVLISWVVLLPVTVGAAGALYSWLERPAEMWLRQQGPQPR